MRTGVESLNEDLCEAGAMMGRPLTTDRRPPPAPCSQFGAQDPGSNSEIKSFAKGQYKISFREQQDPLPAVIVHLFVPLALLVALHVRRRGARVERQMRRARPPSPPLPRAPLPHMLCQTPHRPSSHQPCSPGWTSTAPAPLTPLPPPPPVHGHSQASSTH